MKNIVFAAAFALVVIVGSSSEVSAQKFSRVVTDAQRWESIMFQALDECTGNAKDCALDVLENLNISVGEEPDLSIYRLGETEGKNVTVVFVSHLPEDNDSVLGYLYRLELSREGENDGSFSLDALGRMYQCMEGPVGWRKTACP